MMNPLQFGTRLHFVSPETYKQIYIEHYLKYAPEAKHPWTAEEIINTTDIGHTRLIDCCTAGYIRQPEENTTVFHLSIPAISDELKNIEHRFQELQSSDLKESAAHSFMIGGSQEGRFIHTSYQAFGRVKKLIEKLFKPIHHPLSYFLGHRYDNNHAAKWYSDFCHFTRKDTTYISTYEYTGNELTGYVDSPEKLDRVFAYKMIAPQDELWIDGQQVDRIKTK